MCREWECEEVWQKGDGGRRGVGDQTVDWLSPDHHIRLPSHTELWTNHSVAWHNRNNSVMVSELSFGSSCRASKEIRKKRAELERYKSWVQFSAQTPICFVTVFNHLKKRGKLDNNFHPWEKCSMMGEKKLCGWSCLSWFDKGSSVPPPRAWTPAPPQGKSPYLLAHSKPERTVGTRSLWHEHQGNILGTWLSPNPGNHASNRRWQALPGSRAAPGTYCGHVAQGENNPREGGQSPSPDHSHHKPTSCCLKNTWEQGGMIPGFKCIFQAAQSN